MSQPFKQHLIDPEICIRCHTCEMNCPIGAITHDDTNVVVDDDKCDQCLNCIPVCPTGSIDNWRVVTTAYTLDQQLGWDELPDQAALDEPVDDESATREALDADVERLLAEAHQGTGGQAVAPASAAQPLVNLYPLSQPVTARVQGNFRLTGENAEHDVRHIILDFGTRRMPVLEGQSIGVIAPGTDDQGRSFMPRLYSVSSPRDGERPNFNNLSLTVKREPGGVCSGYLCDLPIGAEVQITGPYGATFLMPQDPLARVLMICTGTGSAPFRAFTMHRQRQPTGSGNPLMLVFGARTPETLPYFGPLQKMPTHIIDKHLVFSRAEDQPRQYVQDKLRDLRQSVADLLQDPNGYIYICGLRAMEAGVDSAFGDICQQAGLDWQDLKNRMREEGRFHVETY